MNKICNSFIYFFKNHFGSKLTLQKKTSNHSFSTLKIPKGFIDNGDGTVTDSVTGLMWKKCCEGHQTNKCIGNSKTFIVEQLPNLIVAINHRDGFSNYNDWRYPTTDELESIAQLYLVNKFQNVFSNSPNGSYWSIYIDIYNKREDYVLIELNNKRAGCRDPAHYGKKPGYVRLVRKIVK